MIERWKKRKAEDARAEEVVNLRKELDAERQRADDAEAALIEIADIVAAQDDALVELAGYLAEQ